jgi:Immunity protein 71/Immunity protein 72
MSVLTPTPLERRKIFYHLQKCSSYTAWSRILPYYQAWANVLEKSVAEAADKSTFESPAYLKTQELVFVLKGLSTFEKCLSLLRRGDKSLFRHDGATCLAVASRPLDFWSEIWGRGEAFAEAMNNPNLVPYWDEILTAYTSTSHTWGEIGVHIQDTSDTHDTAPFALWEEGRHFFFNNRAYKNPFNDDVMPPYHFPANLPEVPDLEEVVLIGYGDSVPCSGIWEPVKADVPKRKLVSLFSKPDMPSGPFEVVGSMNYLHEHSTAPHIGEGREPIPTTWRLLWKDDRYTDGTIPEEENDYIFNEPRERTSTPTSSSSNTSDTIIFARTGERVIKAGVWAVQEDLNARQVFSVGDLLPQHAEREVTWVWTAS